jgi:hypothetical protein
MIAGLTSCMALAVPGARAEMYAPERVGNGCLGGAVDAGGDFLFATVRGHF